MIVVAQNLNGDKFQDKFLQQGVFCLEKVFWVKFMLKF